MQAHALGDHAVLIDCAVDDVAGWVQTARSIAPDALDIVPAASSVLIDGVDVDEALAALRGRHPARLAEEDSAFVELPTVYDGQHLAAVAEMWGCSVEEAVRRHQDTEFTVAFCGFSPGFAYLTGLPEQWAVPRLSSPLTRVPPGSVGLAGRYTGIYPTASPGGWQLIGRTEAVLWDPTRNNPALLAPRTRVRFVDA